MSPESSASSCVPVLGGNRALFACVRDLAARGERCVLCVVLRTQGSTYRKPGALILLDGAGVRVGALSGGCLEAELEGHARAVLADGHARAVRFDTSGDEDRVFGSGTGCGGSTQVLLLPLPAGASPLRDALLDADRHGATLTLRFANAEAARGSGIVCVQAMDGERVYRFDLDGVQAPNGATEEAPITLLIAPPPRLLLLGAGPETRPLLQLTHLLGWHVELAEHRERWARFAAGCGIDRLHGDGPTRLPDLLDGTRFAAALVMHHNLDLDAHALERLADADIHWLGLLGPPARRDALLLEIGEDAAARLQPRLHAPVGLPLGGEGAEAIALAIAAQLQTHFARHAHA